MERLAFGLLAVLLGGFVVVAFLSAIGRYP